MKQKEFNKLTESLDTVIHHGQTIAEFVKQNKDVHEWTINEFTKTKRSSQAFQSRVDVFLSSDLYHIIGMGSLSACQLTKFLTQVRIILKYRAMSKSINAMKDLNTVPNDIVKTVSEANGYNCNTCGINLISSVDINSL